MQILFLRFEQQRDHALMYATSYEHHVEKFAALYEEDIFCTPYASCRILYKSSYVKQPGSVVLLQRLMT